MKVFFNTMSAKGTHFQQRAKTTWQTFLFMPIRYWKITLVVFASILIIILLVDAWLFWHFAQTPPQDPDQTTSGRFTLNLTELESAIRFLREREIKLLQKDETAPLREIFNIPQTVISTP